MKVNLVILKFVATESCGLAEDRQIVCSAGRRGDTGNYIDMLRPSLRAKRINDLMDVIGVRVFAEAYVACELPHRTIAARVHRVQARDAMRPRVVDESLKQQLPEALVLIVVGDGDRYFGARLLS